MLIDPLVLNAPIYRTQACASLTPPSPLQANYGQVVKAMAEAERYPGTSLLVAYSPCVLQGIDGGMCNAQGNAREAAASGYWPLYRLVWGGGLL